MANPSPPFKGKRIAVLGLNPAGVEMVKALAKGGAQVMGLGFGADQKAQEVKKELAGTPCQLYFRMPPEHALLKFDLVVDTPGGGTYRKLIERANQGGVPVLSDLDFVAPFLKGKIIGITGTNGKSSTIAFLDTMLRRQGFKTLVLGGDFFSFATALQVKKNFDFCLVELSSRRLEISRTFHPHIAILLNIFVAHGDRHQGGIEAYYDAKSKIFALQEEKDFLIHEGTAANLKTLLKLKKPHSVKIPFSLHGQVSAPGLFLDKGNILWMSPEDEMEIYSLKKCPIRTAPHILNLMPALAAARLCGVQPKVIQEVIDRYRGLPHRMQGVRHLAKVLFIDDSRATNPGATIWALSSLTRPVIWIAGGSVRMEAHLEEIPRQAKGKVRVIITVGRQRKKLAKILKGMAPIAEVETLKEAVGVAFRHAVPPDIVIYSPACPSDPMDALNKKGGMTFQSAVIALDSMDRLLPKKTNSKFS